ncbi:hypothetical protein [Paenibacillus sp. LHD-38]|uniref:hypothetical protein n=1 Tax=Paenibacillus sp. LHD-38 TaxID=3072143 RepID=UPI00280C7AB8|nr:hypothetical protein [Paenibacillus sp. LHD-38]MDQ8738615.1 hypothetical protein [Paenibacillus sp. LHD-38]
MDPVIGLDISKAESHGKAFLSVEKPFRETFDFEHTRAGLAKQFQFAQDLAYVCNEHYQSPVVQFSANFVKALASRAL